MFRVFFFIGYVAPHGGRTCAALSLRSTTRFRESCGPGMPGPYILCYGICSHRIIVEIFPKIGYTIL